MTATPSLEYRPDIDGLRAIAVLSVVLYHFQWSALSGGFLGVDVFFVISGYLITRLIRNEILATGSFRYSNFLLRRTRRLFPAAAFALFVSAGAALLIFSPMHLERFGEELIAAIFSVSNILFYKESGYFDIDSHYKPLLHTWSLGVEEQFYLFWPPLIYLTSRWRPRVGMILLAVGGVASLIGAEILRDRDAAFYLTPMRVFEFAAGAALVWLDEKPLPRAAVQEAGLGLGLTAIAASVVLLSSADRLPGFLSLLPVCGAVLVLRFGRAPVLGLLLRNALSVWIGRISYSLYLMHWPLMVFYVYTRPEPLSWAERIVLPLVCVGLAGLMYYFIEQPFRHASQSRRNRQFLYGVAASALLCTLVGTFMIVGKGLPWRLPADVAKLVVSPERKVVLKDCQYDAVEIDASLQSRFDACLASSGAAVVVFGDSHGTDLFNALAVNGARAHVVGITKSACRPDAPREDCYYDALLGFLERNRPNITDIVYTQKGSYLLSGEERLDLDATALEKVGDYLREVAAVGIPVVWVGPQQEPNFDVERAAAMLTPVGAADYLRNESPRISELDGVIRKSISERNIPVTYVSKRETIGPVTDGDFVVDGEYTYSDTDHWSAKGEEVFGKRLLEASPVLRSIFGQVTTAIK